MDNRFPERVCLEFNLEEGKVKLVIASHFLLLDRAINPMATKVAWLMKPVLLRWPKQNLVVPLFAQ